MQRDIPPFRADHVGSLLRPLAVKQARGKRAAGQLSAAELMAIEDAEIKKIIVQQEAIGLRSITDGELRRAYWHFDFLAGLDGVAMVEADKGIKFAGVTSKAVGALRQGQARLRATIRRSRISSFSGRTPSAPSKMTIPSPSMLHYRGGRSMIDRAAYTEHGGVLLSISVKPIN